MNLEGLSVGAGPGRQDVLDPQRGSRDGDLISKRERPNAVATAPIQPQSQGSGRDRAAAGSR